jgi:ferric-dicitrate binding protein FerR (iron transport regulator)
MNEERVWLLLSLQLSGEATAEELEEYNALLQQYPELGMRAEIMRNVWHSKQQSSPVSAGNFDKHLQRLSNHLAAPALQFENDQADNTPVVEINHRRRYRWLWLAAGAAACALVFFLTLTNTEKNNIKPVIAKNTISTRPGSKSKIELPDGTQVWLNADSKLTYDQNFLGNTREVNLTGEAYFDVAHATSLKTGQRIPFIIHTSSIDIKVLGTAFNVRSYPGEKTTETALIRGSVEVTLHNSPDKKIILKPEEKLIVKNDDATIINNGEHQNEAVAEEEPVMMLSKMQPYKKDSACHYETMWVKNKLAFENESFERMLPEIERWYNVTFVVKDESLKKLHFRGVFENKSLTDVMEALSLSTKFHYEIKGDQVIVW